MRRPRAREKGAPMPLGGPGGDVSKSGYPSAPGHHQYSKATVRVPRRAVAQGSQAGSRYIVWGCGHAERRVRGGPRKCRGEHSRWEVRYLAGANVQSSTGVWARRAGGLSPWGCLRTSRQAAEGRLVSCLCGFILTIELLLPPPACACPPCNGHSSSGIRMGSSRAATLAGDSQRQGLWPATGGLPQ